MLGLEAGQQSAGYAWPRMAKSAHKVTIDSLSHLLADSASCASEGPVFLLDSRSRDACIHHILRATGMMRNMRSAEAPWFSRLFVLLAAKF